MTDDVDWRGYRVMPLVRVSGPLRVDFDAHWWRLAISRGLDVLERGPTAMPGGKKRNARLRIPATLYVRATRVALSLGRTDVQAVIREASAIGAEEIQRELSDGE